MESFDVHLGSFDSWAESLESFRGAVVRRPREESDAAGVFWIKVNGFLRFLTGQGKEDDPDVKELRRLFSGYAKLEDTALKKARLDVLDLCLKICTKFRDERKRKAIASIITAL
jgi:hypothetical protein